MLTNVSCIYAARCLATNKRYIGSALKGLSRSRSHIRSLRKGIHHNRYLQNAWAKHGEAGFVWELIEACAANLLRQREQFWINRYNSADPRHGYNIAYPVRQRLPSKRMSKRHKQYWASLTEEEYQDRIACYDEDFRRHASEIRTEPAYSLNISNKASERWAREAFRQKMEAIFDAFWSDPLKRAEAIRVRSENAAKDWDGNIARRQATSEAKVVLWQNEDYRRERTEGTTKLWENPNYRQTVTASIKATCNSPEYLAALSERTKQQWAKRKAAGKNRLGDN